MNDHEHTEVSYLTHVKIPYHLEYQQLELDPGAKGEDIREAINHAQELRLSEDEWKRVIISTALLINTGKNYTVGECFDTALIWERG
jgi:hypothetical protein